MITEVVRADQTIFDICVWKYGTLQEITRLVRDNASNYDTSLLQGDDIQINDDIQIGNYTNRLFYESSKYIPTSNVDNERVINDFIFLDGNDFIFLDGKDFVFLT